MGKFKSVVVDTEKCTGCRVCEYVCSMEHCGVFNPARSHIRVVRSYPHSNAAFACRLCEDTPCITSCPHKGAMTQDKETGVIRINDELCDGCDKCMAACERGSIILDNKKARMCDLCESREGGPACIEWCPENALELAVDDSPKAGIRAAPEEVTQA